MVDVCLLGRWLVMGARVATESKHTGTQGKQVTLHVA